MSGDWLCFSSVLTRSVAFVNAEAAVFACFEARGLFCAVALEALRATSANEHEFALGVFQRLGARGLLATVLHCWAFAHVRGWCALSQVAVLLSKLE